MSALPSGAAGGPAYAELAVTSNFSFLRGASHPEEFAGAAAALGLAGFAVADRNTLAGVVRAHMAAKEAGAPFRVGCRLVFGEDDEAEAAGPAVPDVLAWPTDRAAYGRLCRLLTVGNRRAAKGRCRLGLDDLLDWGEGLILAPLAGRRVTGADGERLAGTLDALRAAFGRDNVRLAASLAYGAGDRRRLAALVRLGRDAGIRLLVVGDVN